MDIGMSGFVLPKVTGERLRKLIDVLKNAPRDPACGCIVLSETLKQVIRALGREEAEATGGDPHGDGSAD